MAIIKCKNCGGDMELTADKTFGTCEFCGSTMTLPKVSDEQRAAAFNRGNHFRRIGEFDKALSIYERLLQEDDTDAEAHWCCALCRFGIEYVEDPGSMEFLPTCHRASFDSFLDDVDYLAAVEYSEGITRRQYQKDASKIAEVQRGILATSQNAEPYDVFICYKETDAQGQRTRDSLLAQEIYYQLTEQGRKVFFARITLEDVAGAQYEPYIFAALNSAKVMIVVGTKPEYLNAVWVKNEWSRFLAMMKKDRHKLLLPCYRDMDPYDMPEQLAVLQSYDMSKIGFIQDLTRGISKVLDTEKQHAVQETVVVQQAGSSNVKALLKRGTMALEDGEWAKADGFFEEVLNQNAECAEAYLGKVLISEKATSFAAMVEQRRAQLERVETAQIPMKAEESHIRDMCKHYAVEEYLTEREIRSLYDANLAYSSSVAFCEEQRKLEKAFWEQNRHISRAIDFAQGDLKTSLLQARQQLLDAAQNRLSQAEAEAARGKAELEKKYAEHLAKADAEVEKRHRRAENNRALDIREAEERRVEEMARRYRAKKKENRLILLCVLAGILVIAFSVINSKVLKPMQEYNEAKVLMDAGDYEAAAKAFQDMGEYKDAPTQYREAVLANAKELMERGEHSLAASRLKSLENYGEAPILYREACLQDIEYWLHNGEKTAAENSRDNIFEYTQMADGKIATDDFLRDFEKALTDRNDALEAGQALETAVEAELKVLLRYLSYHFEDSTLQEMAHGYIRELVMQKWYIAIGDTYTPDWDGCTSKRYAWIYQINRDYGFLEDHPHLAQFYIGDAFLQNALDLIHNALAQISMNKDYIFLENPTVFDFSVVIKFEYDKIPEGGQSELYVETVKAGERTAVPNDTKIDWDTFTDWDNMHVSCDFGSVYLNGEYIGEGA